MVEVIKKSRYLLLLFILLAITSSCFSYKRWWGSDNWKWIVSMDGRGYYAYLPALFIFSDPTYSFYEKHTLIEGDIANFSNKIEAGTINKYFYGEALLLSPFFLTAHGVANIADYATTGYSQPYYFGVLIAAMFYYLAGIYFLWLLLLSMRFSKGVAFITCLAFAVGTNLFYYTVYEPSMSHVYSFFAVSALLYFLHSFYKEPQKKTTLFLAFFLGLVLILRPINGILIFLIPFIAGDTKHLKNASLFVFKNYITLILSLFIVLALIFGQLLLYYWQNGQFIVWSYKDEGFDFGDPQIMSSLFSYMKGFFVYTPLAFISLFGLLIFIKKKPYLFFTGLVPLCIIVYVVSSWHSWFYGWSFGLRAYIDYYPVFAIFLAYLLYACLKNKWSFILIAILLIATTAFCAIQTYQINTHILHMQNMNKERYWSVFCKTGSKYEKIFYDTPNQSVDTSLLVICRSQENNMEGPIQWRNMASVKKGIAHSGHSSSVVSTQNNYSVTYFSPLSAIDSIGATHIRVGLWIYAKSGNVNPEIIISFENNKGSYSYNSFPLLKNIKIGVWSYAEKTFALNDKAGEKNNVKVYVINNSDVVYIDDMRIDFLK